MDTNQRANLGCGTLILIALIVLIFGNAGNQDLKTELQQLRQQVSTLEQKIDEQSIQLTAMQQVLTPPSADPLQETQ